MNIEKLTVAAIMALGIAGSAALANVGRLEAGEDLGRLTVASEMVEGEVIGAELPGHAEETFFRFLGN